MTTKESLKPCECLSQLQARLIAQGYVPLPVMVAPGVFPWQIGLVTGTRVLDAKGRPRRGMFIEFNFCPWCGKKIRSLKKMEVQGDGKPTDLGSGDGSPAAEGGEGE